MRFTNLLILAFVLALASFSFAWPAYVADTWNTNQVYAGSYYAASTPYSGFVYNAYYPSNGYAVMGGGRYVPPGYYSGSYAVYPVYNYPSYGYPAYNADPGHYVGGSYYGAPVHTTSVEFSYRSPGFSIYCSFSTC